LTSLPARARNLTPAPLFRAVLMTAGGVNALEEDFTIPPSVGKDGIGWEFGAIKYLESQSFGMQEAHFLERLAAKSMLYITIDSSRIGSSVSYRIMRTGVFLPVSITFGMY